MREPSSPAPSTATLPGEAAPPTRGEPEGDVVANVEDLEVGSTRMVRVDGRRLCLARTIEGVFAIDNACPHEGYGLTQGELVGDVLTCEWHNREFRVSDGVCLQGEEQVTAHTVDVGADGGVRVALNRPDPDAQRPRLFASLRRAIERSYRGQVARDTIRLLQGGATPAAVMWEAIAHGAPRSDFGWGHPVAAATDCLAMVELFDGDQRALPLVQGIMGIAETERDRHVNELPAPCPGADASASAFRRAVEAEHTAAAQSIVLAAIARGDDAASLRRWFTAAVCDHHLSYGHGAIYGQKAFELLDMIGWDHADVVLGHLVPTLVSGTREDRLPYMRPFMRAMGEQGLDALAEVAVDPEWVDAEDGDGGSGAVDGPLGRALLGPDRVAALRAASGALRAGAGVEGLLDVVVEATSLRMLRYETDGEFEFGDDFGWLDITHGLTYAHAVRWHHRHVVEAGQETTPDLVRLALFCVFQANWTGRHEWHTRVGPVADVERPAADLVAYGRNLQRRSLLDGAGSFIVAAHEVKTSRAAAAEALRIGSALPLDAANRFMSAPRQERFVAATVERSIEFLNGRTQRDG